MKALLMIEYADLKSKRECGIENVKISYLEIRYFGKNNF